MECLGEKWDTFSLIKSACLGEKPQEGEEWNFRMTPKFREEEIKHTYRCGI